MLVALQNEHTLSRFAVSAGRSLGNAVGRNRAKRLIRESLRPLIPAISPGWDILFLARRKIVGASLDQVRAALETLLERASLVQNERGR